MQIRFVKVDDAAQLLAIYSPFVTNTATSFEAVAPTVQQFAERITGYTGKYPWLVAEVNGQIAGYACASKHREREAYQWCVEASVYVHPAFYRQGIAQQLYTKLFYLLQQQQFVNVYAIIALPNAASVALHQQMGFATVGVYENIGFKFGQWHNVLWMVKYINPHTANPALPLPVASIMHLV